jgi:hypothetical protein
MTHQQSFNEILSRTKFEQGLRQANSTLSCSRRESTKTSAGGHSWAPANCDTPQFPEKERFVEFHEQGTNVWSWVYKFPSLVHETKERP